MRARFFNERRVGKIQVQAAEGPSVLIAATEGCAVLDCRYSVGDDCFVMEIYHPELEIVEFGQRSQGYHVIMTIEDGKHRRVRFEKAEL